jgi:hypothetical protein
MRRNLTKLHIVQSGTTKTPLIPQKGLRRVSAPQSDWHVFRGQSEATGTG